MGYSLRASSQSLHVTNDPGGKIVLLRNVSGPNSLNLRSLSIASICWLGIEFLGIEFWRLSRPSLPPLASSRQYVVLPLRIAYDVELHNVLS